MGKAFEKQTKTIEDQGKKQVDALTVLKISNKKLPSIKDFISIENLNPEIVNERKRIGEMVKYADRDKMVYKSTNKIYDFRSFKTIRTFGNEIRNNVTSMITVQESQEGEGLKILISNQMLKRLLIALAQIKAGNNSETLLNEIRQIVYSLYRSKEITKKVYNNIIK